MKALGLVILALVGCATPSIRGDFRNQLGADDQTIQIAGKIDEGNDGLLLAAIVLESAPRAIHLMIDSPGGSVRVGVGFIEIMRSAQESGTVILCTIPSGGMAASMAAVIFERCDVRTMERGSALMFHTVSVGGVEGNQWDMERLARYMASLNRRLAILASAKLSISLAEYEARVADNDWWLGWEEAVAVGAADASR